MQNDPKRNAFDRAALPVLRRLKESGSRLAVPDNMAKAAVLRRLSRFQLQRTALISTAHAREMVRLGWLDVLAVAGGVTSYTISAKGDVARLSLLSDQKDRTGAWARGAKAAQPPRHTPEPEAPRLPASIAGTPIAKLARPHGSARSAPFLSPEQVAAAIRFQEAYARANGSAPSPDIAAEVRETLAHLPTGMDGVVREVVGEGCGLVGFEKRQGWSARSGKVVLRIALDWLVDYYKTHPEGAVG